MRFPASATGFVWRQVIDNLVSFKPPLITDLIADLAGDIVDIVTPVPVFRESQLFATQFQVAEPDTDGEDIHLPAIVIDIVLTLNPVSRSLENAGQAGAIGGAPAVTDMQWPGGVGGHELDRDLVLGVRRHVPVAALPWYRMSLTTVVIATWFM